MKTNIFSKRIAVIFVVLFGAVGVYLLWKTLAAPVSTSLKPNADALVYQSESGRTYGSEKVLRTDGSPIMRSYLRFKVDAATPIKKATLRIFAETANSGGYKVATTNNSWTEGAINYSNAPAPGAAAGSSGGFKAGTWTSVDVTSVVKANGEYSFVLSGADSTQTRYSSRESANPPQLVIETDSTGTPTPPPTPTPTPGTTQRAAFYYPWFPETWTVNGAKVAYQPLLGYYDSSTQSVADSHIKAMDYAGINVAIASWWGSGTHDEAVRLPQLLNRTTALGSPLKWAIYYEKEGTNDPSVGELQADLGYLKTKYASNPAFAKANGKPVLFVYNASANDNSCAVVDRWAQANTGYDFYLVLKVFPGYKSCSKQPDSWHQYSPAVADDNQSGYSYSISPGFKRADEANARLGRDPARWTQSIKNMVASKAPWQIVTTFNEWGEGTAIEAAQEWGSASGYGTYIDALHNILSGTTPAPTPPPPPAVDTTKPTAPTGFSANATSTTQVATKWTAATDNVGVTKYNVIRNGTVVGSVPGTTASFTDTSALPSTTYTYGAVAVDGAGNESPLSNTVIVTTPALPTPDTAPPSAPPSLTGTAISSTQINLSWGASTDNVGVSAYIVYRGGTQVARVTSRTYGDSTLSAGTSYSYYVKAADTANNLSVASNTVAITTPSPAPPPPPPPTTSGSVCGTRAAAPAKYSHVLVIVMENKRYADVIGSSSAPFESGLVKQCASATAYAQAGSPSRPNYIAMVSGSVQGCNGSNADPPSCQTTADNIMRQARVAGGTSKVYAESMNSNCQYASGSGYATKHNPFPYFIGADDQAACARDNVPLGSNTAGNFINDLNADRLPNWAMIDPNLCNDTHDCSVATGDNWLKVLLQDHVFKSAAYARGDMAVIIVQDEYTNLPNVWIAPSVKPGSVYSGPMTHAGLLKTMEEMLGYPTIPAAASAHSVRNDFNL